MRGFLRICQWHPGSHIRGMDVLLVEDNRGDIRLAQECFRVAEPPINLHIARDGLEAMAFLRRESDNMHAPRPNLILLDLNLPKMDGRQVLAEIKNDVGLKSIPTIILTSSELMTDLSYCYENSANCYLRKPTNWDAFNELVGVINNFWLVLIRLPTNGAPEATEIGPVV
jgi:chemotaxis family two-component system response regulator Rcp1